MDNLDILLGIFLALVLMGALLDNEMILQAFMVPLMFTIGYYVAQDEKKEKQKSPPAFRGPAISEKAY